MLQDDSCSNSLRKYALDLINRQKAEIEILREENRILSHDADTAFQEGLNENRDLFKKEVEPEIKAEAIEKFAEELEYFVLNEDIEVVEPKCKDYESYINGANQFRHQIKNGINNLVKEMTE